MDICSWQHGPVMSGEKQTLHSTVRTLQVGAAVSRSAEAALHHDPYDLHSSHDSALFERESCRMTPGLESIG